MDPDVAAMLRGRPAPVDYRTSPIARARDIVENRVHRPGPSMHAVTDHEVIGVHGGFSVRVYRPGPATRAPGILYFHGGGMVVGSVRSFDGFARSLAHATDAVVVSVDYHLAPEHPYPVATDEAFEALTWLMGDAERLGIDPTRIAVVGDSAGGTIAAGLTLRWRDSGGTPSVRAQALLYPGTDEGFDYPSAAEFAHGPVLTLTNARWMREQYLGKDTSEVTAYAIPSRATDLSGLPPTIVFTAELDLIRDGGEDFARSLRESGVLVVHARYPGVLHGFVTQEVERGKAALRDLAALLAVWLAGDGPDGPRNPRGGPGCPHARSPEITTEGPVL